VQRYAMLSHFREFRTLEQEITTETTSAHKNQKATNRNRAHTIAKAEKGTDNKTSAYAPLLA
jgi:hypothetical protein